MAYSEELAGRIRLALSHLPKVEERKMFGGLAFMINDKMCITVGADRIMCRIDPADHESLLKKKGCSSVVMKNREYKGYIRISEDVIKKQEDLHYWVEMARSLSV